MEFSPARWKRLIKNLQSLWIGAHLGNGAVQMRHYVFFVVGEDFRGKLVVKVESFEGFVFLVKTRRHFHQSIGIVMDGHQLAADRKGLLHFIHLQVGGYKVAQPIDARVNIGNSFVEFGSLFVVSQLKGDLGAEFLSSKVAAIERDEAVENLLRRFERMAIDEGGGGLRQHLLGFVLLAALVHQIGGAGDDLHVFRVEEDKLLEQPQCFLGLAFAGVGLGGLQQGGAGIADESLLAVKLGKLFHGRKIISVELDDLLVHRDGLQDGAVGDIGFRDDAEALDRFFVLPEPGINIANRIEDGEISGLGLQNLVVFGDGVLQLVLLQIAFGFCPRLFFVVPESEHDCTPKRLHRKRLRH